MEYSTFWLGPEADKYRLNVTGFSGDDGDAFAKPFKAGYVANGMQFSTPDQDNDMMSGQCGKGKSAGWFNKCGRATLCKDTNGGWNAYSTASPKLITDARMLVKLD